MKLRTRLNLVVAGLSAAFVVVLLAAEIRTQRASVSEEITAANRVAAQLLGHLASVYPQADTDLLAFLHELGRVRAQNIAVLAADGSVLYSSPPSAWKVGRDAPEWFSWMLTPPVDRQVFPLAGGGQLVVEADASRAVLDSWDAFVWLVTVAVIMLLVANGLAFWSVGRALKPFPVIAEGLARVQRGDLGFRLPALAGAEAAVIGEAFNDMVQAVEDKVAAERKARDAETRLEERRELGQLIEQRLEEERRLIAHELHDEFSQSVTAIRSFAVAIGTRTAHGDTEVAGTAKLIADEAARLYDAMHGLIPRLEPLTLDSLGLAETLENLVRDWQSRRPDVALSIEYDVTCTLGHSVTLTIYRIVQEGLINALRHARASCIAIGVRADAERIVVSVADDGVGLPAEWCGPGHFGLRGLAARVESLNGTFGVANRGPRGVLLTAEIPLAQRVAA